MTGNGSARPAGNGTGAEQITIGGGSAEAIVPRASDTAPDSRGELGRGDASVVPPTDGRVVVRAVTRCATCGSVTVHPFASVDGVNGTARRGACGHRYTIRVRRVLSQWAA